MNTIVAEPFLRKNSFSLVKDSLDDFDNKYNKNPFQSKRERYSSDNNNFKICQELIVNNQTSEEKNPVGKIEKKQQQQTQQCQKYQQPQQEQQQQPKPNLSLEFKGLQNITLFEKKKNINITQ